MNKIVLTLLLLAIPCSAMTAKEAWKQTETARRRLAHEQIQQDKDETARLKKDISQDIGNAIDLGACSIREEYMPYDYKLIHDYFDTLRGNGYLIAEVRPNFQETPDVLINWCFHAR